MSSCATSHCSGSFSNVSMSAAVGRSMEKSTDSMSSGRCGRSGRHTLEKSLALATRLRYACRTRGASHASLAAPPPDADHAASCASAVDTTSGAMDLLKMAASGRSGRFSSSSSSAKSDGLPYLSATRAMIFAAHFFAFHQGHCARASSSDGWPPTPPAPSALPSTALHSPHHAMKLADVHAAGYAPKR